MLLLKVDDDVDSNDDQIQEALPLSSLKMKHRQISLLLNDAFLKENHVENVLLPLLLPRSKHRQASSLQLQIFHSAD